jgi:hypothetical protein
MLYVGDDAVNALKEQFRLLIDRPDVTEPEIQRFMEQHSELIPTPYRLNHDLYAEGILSKFELDRDKKVDLAFLTKSSAEWRLVLIELERPQKQLFIETPYTDFHSDTRYAISQIEDWKSFVESHPQELRRRIEPFMRPRQFRDNPIGVKYLLVIGRHPAPTYNREQSARLKRLCEESSIQMITYDSMLRMQPSYGIGHKKNIFSHDRSGYKFKHVHTEHTGIFGWHRHDELGISPDQIAWFESRGFDMQAWRRGELLSFNGRRTKSDGMRRPPTVGGETSSPE